MALDGETAASGLIRQVQKPLGQGIAGGAARRRCSTAATASTAWTRLPPAWLAGNAREALEFIADKPKGRHKIRVRARGGQPRHAPRGHGGRDPQRRHAVPGRLGAGRAAGARARRAPAAAPDLQDPARQGRPPAGDRRPRRPELERRAPGKLHRHPPRAPAGAPRRAISPRPCPPSSPRCASSSRTGSRCCSACEAAIAQLEAGAAPACRRDLLPEFDRLPALAGAGQLHVPRRRASSSSPGDPETGDLVPRRRQRPRRAARPGGAGAAARHRAGRHDAGGAPLLLRARAADHHQGQRGQPRAPARAHGLHRRQDLPRRRHAQGRAPHRRPLHVAGLRALAARDPAPAPQGRDRARGVGLSARQPRRQGAAQHPRHLPARRAVPDRRRAAAGMGRGHPRSGDAAARARVRPRRPLRPVRVGCSSTCPRDRYTPERARAHRRAAGGGLQRPRRRVLSLLPRRPAGAGAVHHRPLRGRDAARSMSASWSARIADIVRTWDDRLADAIAGIGRARRARCWPSIGTRLLAGLRGDLPARARAGGHQAHRAAGPRPAGRHRFLSRARLRRRTASTPPSTRFGAPIRLSERVPVLENLGFSAIDERSYHVHAALSPTARARSPCTTWCWRPPTARRSISSSTTSGWRTLPRRLPRRRRQRRLQPPDRRGRRRLARGGRAEGLCRLPAPARLAVRPALPRRYARRAMPASRAICWSCSICASIRRAGSDVEARDGGRGSRSGSASKARWPPCRASTRTASCASSSTSSAPPCAPTSTSRRGRRPPADASPSSSTARRWRPRRSRAPSARSGSTRRAWRASTCALRRSRAAASAGRTGRRISAPRCWGWCARSSSRTPSSCRRAPRAASCPSSCRAPAAARRSRRKASPPTASSSPPCSTSPTTSRTARSCRRSACVRHDGDDPYLVVAADKGTATFSDIANEISAAHDFWLGDAFASGGSAGYDHKGMAITARGAWECVKRHFREMDIDIQRAAVPGGRRRRHVGRRVRQRHAAVRAHPAGGGVRSPRHLHRSEPGRRQLCRAQAPVRSAALELAGLRQGQDLQGRRRVPARGQVDPAQRRDAGAARASMRRASRRPS